MGDEFEPLNQDEVDAVDCELIDENAKGFSGSSEQGNKSEFIGAKACGKICSALSDLLASRKGEQFKLSSDEAEKLGEALDPVLSKYMPESGEDFSAELSLAMVAFAIIVPRISGNSE